MTTSESSQSSSQNSSQSKNNKSDDCRSQTAFVRQNEDNSNSGGKRHSGAGLEDSTHGSTDRNDQLEPPVDMGPHLTNDLVYLISSLVGRHVQVTVKNGARFEGYLFTTSPYKEHLDIILRHPKVVKCNNRLDNNLPTTDSLIISGQDLATLCASDTTFCSTSVSADFESLSLTDREDQPNSSEDANRSEEGPNLPLDQDWHYYLCTSYGYLYPGAGHYEPFSHNSNTNTYFYRDNQEYMHNHRPRVHYPAMAAPKGGKGAKKSRFNGKNRSDSNKNSNRSNPQGIRNSSEKCNRWGRSGGGLTSDTSNRSTTLAAQRGSSKATGRINMGKKPKIKSTEQNMLTSRSQTTQSPFKLNIDAAEFVPLGLDPTSFMPEKDHCAPQNDSKIPPTTLDTWLSPPFAHALPPKETGPSWPCGTMSYWQNFSPENDQLAFMSHYYSMPMFDHYQRIPYYDGASDYPIPSHAVPMVMYNSSLLPKRKMNTNSPVQYPHP